MIEGAGSAEVVMEVVISGKINHLGEVIDFPKEIGHFVSVFVGSKPGDVFALSIAEDIPHTNMVAGDLILFDMIRKPQAGDICIGPIGDRFFLIQIASKTYDAETTSFETAQNFPIPGAFVNPELNQLLNWYPLAYDDESEDSFKRICEEQNWPIGPIPQDFLLGTALRLIRHLTA
ncbi:MAG TPA: hypothetical protein VIO61_16185 [Anaerolineaceae bacterium]